MSLFLGPIHHIMFDKIKLQEGFVNFLVKSATEKSKSKEFEMKVDLNTPSIPHGKLEDIVDTTNIHGSLQSMIIVVEKKIAFSVDKALKDDIFTIEEILDLAYKYGRNNLIDSNLNLEEVYREISSRILNGMPCDRIEEFLESGENNLRWRDRMDIHAEYWNGVGRDSKIFYDIRTSIIEGMLSNSDVEYFSHEGNVFELRLA